ncbi:MAG: Nramp family divalent metal transporter [Firmicutes bacterium]|nr:Nramp family divalent metal transporter [Bacillota bacterium]
MFIDKIKKYFSEKDKPTLGALEILKYIGPGLLVTVGFIDPGNWASNIAAGSSYGYTLLWMVTLSTLMLIALQHDVAHIGIKTGLCLSEAATEYTKPWISRSILSSAVVAAVATALAEILGGAIALNMLFKLPLKIGAILVAIFVLWMVFTNAYKKLEKIIIGFVSLIGLSFLVELFLVKNLQWNLACAGWITPNVPPDSIPIIMSVLGAVVMPHNLFLHSEVIQSRQWNLEDEAVMEKQLKYEFTDTLVSMLIGWAINSAIIILAAATFFQKHIKVDDLAQAENMLRPLLGNNAAIIFAFALLCSGLASSVTASMAGGTIFAGMFKEPYDINDKHTRIGILITIVFAVIAIFFIKDPFQGLIYSQVFLSMQLPWTIFLQISLSSSKKVMGKFANTTKEKIILWVIAVIVTYLNILLLINFARSFNLI